jgi:hypothetical protein
MSAFLAAEKVHQIRFKATSPTFSDVARADGVYKRKAYPFCLPREYARENLVPEIRQSATAYFKAQKIKWHDGQDGNPSNHLCSSQVCGANFLYPFANKPLALVELLRPVFPTIRNMLPIETRDQFVAFEWIGAQDYLGETRRGRRRTRGANCTSADAAVMFERIDGLRQIVLIEWKYTESYSSQSLAIARSGTDRTAIYAPLFNRDDCPLNKGLLPSFVSLFFEPFYQFMRQQFLGHEMERARELGADVVSVLHIAPARNLNFRAVTAPALRQLGESATDVWKQLVRAPERFISVNTEDLFGRFPIAQFPNLAAWKEYIAARYVWIQ